MAAAVASPIAADAAYAAEDHRAGRGGAAVSSTPDVMARAHARLNGHLGLQGGSPAAAAADAAEVRALSAAWRAAGGGQRSWGAGSSVSSRDHAGAFIRIGDS